jgi:hypothetical protein
MVAWWVWWGQGEDCVKIGLELERVFGTELERKKMNKINSLE